MDIDDNLVKPKIMHDNNISLMQNKGVDDLKSDLSIILDKITAQEIKFNVSKYYFFI
jgi:hypothetical protein